MKMESSRRPFDRSREPDLKKPRLTQDPILPVDRSSNGGRTPFMQRPATAGLAVVSRRVIDRGGDSDNSDSVRGPYSNAQQQQNLELVNQYKTALAELTFNSKPIITNLTIIAGENLHAAKAIAATVCSNILEVSSEQKLPSLYLLDSIVKNIGRDYIKYFGSRLPEVFCKVYRQVDPSVHSGMRHLFGTWKGVFPPQPLLAIEKELDFAAAANRLPSGTSRLDAPVSRPANSIHVNPKYLEARQRLQQSSKQNSQYTERELKLSNGLHTKNISAPFGDSEYDSDISKPSGLEITRVGEKFSGNIRGTVSTQRNGFDAKHGLQNYHLNSKRPTDHGLPDVSTMPKTGSWKNSEEEEYTWDDMNSRAGDHNHAASSMRDRWSLDEYEKMSEASADSPSTEMKDQAVFGNRGILQEPPIPERMRSVAGRTIPGLSESYPISSGGLSTSAGNNGRTSFQSKVARGSNGSPGYGASNSHTLGSTVYVAPQGQILGRASPSAQSLLYPPNSRSSFAGHGVRPVIHHNDTEQDQPWSMNYVEARTSQFSGSLNTDPRNKFGQEDLPFPSLDNKRMMSPNAPRSFSVTPPHSRQDTSFSQQLESDPLVSDLAHQVSKPFSHSLPSKSSSSHDPNPLPLLSSGESSVNSLLVAVSGILNRNSLAEGFSRQSSQTSVSLTSQANNLPLVTGAPQTQLTQSTFGMKISPLSGQSARSILSQRNDKGPVLPTGSVTTDLASRTLLQSAKVTNANMPVSSLLGSLVAKGLISAPKTESTSYTSLTSSQPRNHSPETTKSGSSKFSLSVGSLPISSCAISEVSSAKPVSASTELPSCSQSGIRSHIGFQFKGDVLRVLHPAVISELNNDLPHNCGICEARLKIQDQVGRHLEWHTLRNQRSNSNKASRAWYPDSINTVTEDTEIVSVNEPSGSQEGVIKKPECTEPVVPADESQCLCILCGELFEDFFDQGIAQWMYKGAVYATAPCSDAIGGDVNEVVAEGSIVHVKCISKV